MKVLKTLLVSYRLGHQQTNFNEVRMNLKKSPLDMEALRNDYTAELGRYKRLTRRVNASLIFCVAALFVFFVCVFTIKGMTAFFFVASIISGGIAAFQLASYEGMKELTEFVASRKALGAHGHLDFSSDIVDAYTHYPKAKNKGGSHDS